VQKRELKLSEDKKDAGQYKSKERSISNPKEEKWGRSSFLLF
jgi:hypothetical protein